MTIKEILELFNWTLEEYEAIQPQYKETKYGYFMAIMDIFGQLINYQKENKND